MDNDTKELRAKIHGFIHDRLQAKLDKLKPEDVENRAKREAEHQPGAWLADAARRVGQLQLATHIVKPMHPDARGTNLCAAPQEVHQPGLVGTHSLEGAQANDVVGNAAALDVYKFLCIEHDGQSLLELASNDDERLRSALSDDPSSAEDWQRAFAAITLRKRAPASDSLAKQVYFPLTNDDYHVLAPLFPTSLLHQAQATMREDRFGDAAKAARKARAKGEPLLHGYREYPDLAIRKLGGTKPQNISQLNSERYGENWLLASVPPAWESPSIRPPWNAQSVFPVAFGRLRRVRQLTEQLRKFLQTVAYNNVAIRRRRATLVQRICDEAQQYAALLEELPSGWSAVPQCVLNEAEQLWLDPRRARDDQEFAEQRRRGDWTGEVAHRFGNWLNARLASKALPLGEDEQAQWRADLLKELHLFQGELEVNRD
jgi:CRISPR-associated protein Csy1